MKNQRKKIKLGTVGGEEKSLQKNSIMERQGSKLVHSQRHDLQTADKILQYMQQEEKY
jgi:hypothetical protein